jgi:hypothetical protein
MDNNNIIIYFEKNIIKNIKILHFKINQELEYINNSHVNYLYEFELNDKIYKFHGFYKDSYFVIITEIFDTILKNIIYDKQIILIKIKWVKKNIDNKINLYFLDILQNNYVYIYAPLRKEILISNNLLIDDLLIINNYNTDICKIENLIKSNIGFLKNTDINNYNNYNNDNDDDNNNMINNSYSKNIFKKLSNKILKTLF